MSGSSPPLFSFCVINVGSSDTMSVYLHLLKCVYSFIIFTFTPGLHTEIITIINYVIITIVFINE